jgi:hypothetical protein
MRMLKSSLYNLRDLFLKNKVLVAFNLFKIRHAGIHAKYIELIRAFLQDFFLGSIMNVLLHRFFSSQ